MRMTIGALSFLLLTSSSLAQTALTSTTLAAAVAVTDNEVSVASAAGISAPAVNASLGSLLIIGKETMKVTGVSGTTIAVQRGYAGGVYAHASGATVYEATAAELANYEPYGACTAGTSWAYTPLIVPGTGNLWACIDSRWVNTADVRIGGDLVLESGHTLTIKDTYWDDLRVPLSSTKLGGTKDPTFAKLTDDGAGSQGVFSYDFSNAQENELYFSVQLPHNYSPGSSLEPHIHYTHKAEASGVARWGLECTSSNIAGVFGATTLIYGEETLAAAAAFTHELVPLTSIELSSGQLSAMLVCRVFRPVGVAGMIAASLSLLEIDFHYEVDGFGSSSEYTK